MSTEPVNDENLRPLTTHQNNGLNRTIQVLANDDDKVKGGAARSYLIDGLPGIAPTTVIFHEGDPALVGCTGITHEVLMAILIDRFEGFQKGPFPSPFNDITLHHLRAAMTAQSERALDRSARGVEGKLEP